MQEARMNYLLERYFTKTCTLAEKEELSALLLEMENDEVLKSQVEKIWTNYAPDEQIPLETADRYFNNILQQATRPVPVRKVAYLHSSWLRYAAAAVLISGIAAYAWFSYPHHEKTPVAAAAAANKEIAPGSTGAVLTLADGSQVVLDSLHNGLIATQGGSKVVLGKEGLAYNTGGAATADVTYNTMTTPKGRQFQLLLPDGTKVWLNAASSIRYPTFFNGSERKVTISGEAYFEVAGNDKMPFMVKVGEAAEVLVLGTHFNINAYTGETSINTTLLEGAVQVLAGSEAAVIRPGEQARISAMASAKKMQVVKDIDVNNAIAWKNGYFRFDGMDLPMVMREISRWYDVEVTYKGAIPEKQFGGELPRSITLQHLLKLIEFGDVQLTLSGNHITITGKN